MQYARLLTRIAAPAAAASLALAAPALAHRDDPSRGSSVQQRTEVRAYSQPRAETRSSGAPPSQGDGRIYSEPRAEVRTYSEPRAEVRTYSEPRAEERTYSEPRAEVRTYSEPRPEVRTYREPRPEVRTYREPRPEVRTYSEPRAEVRTYSKPRPEVRVYGKPRLTAAHREQQAKVQPSVRNLSVSRHVRQPIRRATFAGANARVFERHRQARKIPIERREIQVVRSARVRKSVTRPFAQRVRFGARAPFVQYIRASVPRGIASFSRARRAIVAYRPAYLSGRVAWIHRNAVAIVPVTGPVIVIHRRYVQYPVPYRVNEYVTVPAMYNSGTYIAYPYSPQYYPQVAHWYANYFGVPVVFVNGFYLPQYGYNPYGVAYNYGYAPYNGYPFNTYGSYGNYNPYGYGNNPYNYGNYNPYGYGNNPYGYGGDQTPYDSCMWSDEDNDGDGYCNAQSSPYNGYGFGGYSGNGFGSGYQLAQVQGVVVAKSGSMLMVLSGNGLNPVFVNEAPALQNGFAASGPVAIGQLVDAYGFYNGDEFVATALV